MMNKTHTKVGLVTTLWLGFFGLIPVIVAYIASTLPDIDHHNSRIRKKATMTSDKTMQTLTFIFVGLVFIYLYVLTHLLIYLYAALLLFGIPCFDHRGFTHSLLGYTIFTFFIYMVSNAVHEQLMNIGIYFLPHHIVIPFAIGYGMHLLMDVLTVQGIPLFYPFSVKKYSWKLFRTAQRGEKFLRFVMAINLIILVFYWTWHCFANQISFKDIMLAHNFYTTFI